MKTKLLTISGFLATLLFSGCGSETADSGITKQPHNTSKLGRTVSTERDWTWDVSLELKKLDSTTVVQAHFWEGMPKELTNFQVFIDIDNDENTGYSASNGWEIKGADYLIENGIVFKSSSTTNWKWDYIDTYKDKHLFSEGIGKYGLFDWRTSTSKIDTIFNTDSFKVMIEAYDANWKGDCNTITGVVAEVSGSGVGTGGSGLTDTEKKIREKYNAKFTTVTTIDFAPNKQEAIVMMINKWTGKKMYLIDVANIDTATPIAEEYAKKFIYKTNVVKDSGIVEFQVKEDDGAKYKVVYDYKNNKEISKTLIDGAKKYVLTEVKMDTYGDGVFDVITHNSYDDRGNLIQKIVEDASENASYTSTFTYDENNHLIISDINDDYENEHKVFTYDEQGRKKTMTSKSADSTYKIYFTYDDRGNLIKEDETGNYDGENLHIVRTYVYNETNQLLQKKVEMNRENGSVDVAIDIYEYDGDNLIEENHSYNAEHNSKKKYVYNQNNQLIKKVYTTHYSQNVYEYSYNENGKITEEKYTNPHDQVYVTKYSYDENNNLIKKERGNRVTTYVWKKL